MNVNECSGRTLAYLGDAVWSYLVRRYLIEQGEGKGSQLQKKTIHFVSAGAQASFYDRLHEEQFFTEEEEEVFRRGRNDHSGVVPKSASVAVYRKSTGFETIIGMLDLQGKEERIRELFRKVTEEDTL